MTGSKIPDINIPLGDVKVPEVMPSVTAQPEAQVSSEGSLAAAAPDTIIDVSPGSKTNPLTVAPEAQLAKATATMNKMVQEALGRDGFVVADIGVTVARYPIERYKATKARKDLVNYPIPKVIIAKVHYVEGMGYFYCFGKECCEDNGLPTVRYAMLLMKYTTNQRAEPIAKEVEIYAHIMSTDNYGNLQDIKNFSSLDNDIVITCSEETYQKIAFVSTNACLWKKLPDAANLAEKAGQLFKFIPILLGQKMSRVDYLKKRSPEAAGTGLDLASMEGPPPAMDFSALLKG